MKFYIDGDKDYPTICGTGTEDYFGGAWSFATQQMAKPLKISTALRILDILTTLPTIPSFIMITTMMIRCHSAASTAGIFSDPILFEKDL